MHSAGGFFLLCVMYVVNVDYSGKNMFCLSTQHANFLQTTNCTEKSCEYFIWPAPADMHCHYLMIHTDHAMISIYMIKWPQWRHALLNHHLPHHSPVRDLRPTCSSQYRRWATAAGPGCVDHSSVVTRAWRGHQEQFIEHLGPIGRRPTTMI